MEFALRKAKHDDKAEIAELIAISSRELSSRTYSTEQIEAALLSSFGVDSQLIEDQTFFLAFHEQALAGCGGWSFRETLFGSDSEPNRSAAPVDPARGAARIRAFFIHPRFARKGLASLILDECESAARAYGFRQIQLTATMSGVEFYRIKGYLPGTAFFHTLNPQLKIEFLPMTKRLE